MWSGAEDRLDAATCCKLRDRFPQAFPAGTPITLSGLLAVATRYATTVCRLEEASWGEGDPPMPAGAWWFGAGAWPGDVCGGNTPKDAVAAWLLTRADVPHPGLGLQATLRRTGVAGGA